MIRCDQEGCEDEAGISLILRSADGTALSQRWNRCWEHAHIPIPVDITPSGTVIVLDPPREIEH
jgi:hypothetical protein